MNVYIITYRSPGMLSFAPDVNIVYAANKKGALEVFRIDRNEPVRIIELYDHHIWSNNGRYTKYFTSK